MKKFNLPPGTNPEKWVVGPCENEEIAKEVLGIGHKKGWSWVGNNSSLLETTNWEINRDNTCYEFPANEGAYYSRIHSYQSDGYSIVSPSEFIRLNSSECIWQVGDEVWDSFYFHGKKGKVIDIGSKYLTVDFGEKSQGYRLSGGIGFSTPPTLSFTPYEVPTLPVNHKRPEPEYPVGTKGYFWDKEGFSLVYGVFLGRKDGKYIWSTFDRRSELSWKHFSPTLPDWAK